MDLTALEFGELGQGAAAVFVARGDHGESHEHFVGVEARILAAEIVDLGELNRLNHLLRNEFDAMVDAG